MTRRQNAAAFSECDYSQQTSITWFGTRSLNTAAHWCSEETADLPSCCSPGCWQPPCRALYLFGDQQAVGMLYGCALVQQQGLELPLLDVVECVKHNSQELQRGQKATFASAAT